VTLNEMTSLATVPDSLGALKSRRDESARLRSARTPEQDLALTIEREAIAVRAFGAWFRQQHGNGGLAVPADGVLDVQPALSRRFCVGLHDLRYFIGIPKDFMSWFAELPWLRAEVAPDSSSLSLRCKQSKAPGAVLPAFTLNFDVQPPGYTRALLHYHYLDVRAIDTIPSAGGAFHISREVYLTLSIRVLATGAVRPADSAAR
jgi:hypothetical protein